MSNFSLSCACCEVALIVATDSNLGSWRGVANGGGLVCQVCGCQLRIPGAAEDAISVGPPEITGIDVSSGSVVGGTVVTFTGHGFDLGNLRISFGDHSGVNIRSITNSNVVVDSPPSSANLNTQGLVRRKLLVSGTTTSPFQIGETITGGTSGKTATVREVDDTFVYVDTWDGEFVDGEELTGSSSSATATAGEFKGEFQASEMITGLTSDDSSSLVGSESSPLAAHAFSGGYDAGEWVVGSESEAKVQLADSNHLDGPIVNVVVGNQYGKRLSGGTLLSAFAYVAPA